MCFQLTNSVSQLAFGHIADRWRPRVLLIAGPILCVIVLPLIGLAPSPVTLAMVLILGGPRRRRISSAPNSEPLPTINSQPLPTTNSTSADSQLQISQPHGECLGSVGS
jgi:hypothetical protein